MKLSSDLPGKIPLPFAASGGKRTIPTASQISITPGAASLEDGFPPLTRTPLAAGGIPPSGLDMNGIMYEMSAVIRWANAGGGMPYDATFATDSHVNGYPKGARVLRTDGQGYWFNTVDDNTTDPEAGGAGWVPDFTAGVTAITMTNANVTLTPLQYGKRVIVITGLCVAPLNLILPAIAADWFIINSTTGSGTITAKTPSGTGVLLPQNGAYVVNGDGTNIYSTDADLSNPAKGVRPLAYTHRNKTNAPSLPAGVSLDDTRVSLRKYDGADDWVGPGSGIGSATDNWTALQKILLDYPAGCVIDLPFVGSGVYYFSTIGYNVLNGYTLNPDPGVVLRFPSAWALAEPLALCTRPVHCYFEDLQYSGWYSPYVNRTELEKTMFLAHGDADQSRVLPIDLANNGGHVVNVPWPDGPYADGGNATTSYMCTLTPPINGGAFQFMEVPAFAGEDVNVCFRPDSTYGNGFVGFFVRLSDGYFISYANPGGGTAPQYGIKHGSSPVNPVTYDYKGRTTHASYWPEKSLCTIRVHNSRSFSLLLNGVEILFIKDVGADILGVGFGGGYNSSASSIVLTHWTRTVNKPASGKRPLSLVVIGDSITDGSVHSSWTYAMREALENAYGVRVENFLNLAVSGEASAQQLAHLQAADTAGTLAAYNGGVMCIQIGVNDIQGLNDVGTYVNNVDAMIAIAKAHGMQIVAGTPTMFYTRGQSTAFGGLGQASANYDQGAYYRAAVLYEFAAQGCKPVPGVLEDLGPVLAEYLAPVGGNVKDPIMRDNIHPTAYGYRLMGYAYAKAIVGAMQPKVDRSYDRATIASYAAITQSNAALFSLNESGNAAGFRVDAADHVTFNGWCKLLSALTSGQINTALQVAVLPRNLWPETDVRLTCPATNVTGGPLAETVMIHLQANGVLNVWFTSTNPRGFYFDNLQYVRAWSGGRR